MELGQSTSIGDRMSGLFATEPLEALPMPFDDGLWFDNDQDLPPILPDLRDNHPEESISPMQLRPEGLANSRNCNTTNDGTCQRITRSPGEFYLSFVGSTTDISCG